MKFDLVIKNAFAGLGRAFGKLFLDKVLESKKWL